jgi:hypothetical protein
LTFPPSADVDTLKADLARTTVFSRSVIDYVFREILSIGGSSIAAQELILQSQRLARSPIELTDFIVQTYNRQKERR